MPLTRSPLDGVRSRQAAVKSRRVQDREHDTVDHVDRLAGEVRRRARELREVLVEDHEDAVVERPRKLRQTDADEVVADERRHLRSDQAGDRRRSPRVAGDELPPPITGRERCFECVYCHAGPPPTDDISDVIYAKGYDRVQALVRTFAQRTGVGMRTYAGRMPWIRTIDPDDATGRLAELYGWQSSKLGRPDRVHPDRQPRPRSRATRASCSTRRPKVCRQR